jgi:hypothetical protein
LARESYMRIRWDTEPIAKRDLAKFFLFDRDDLSRAESLLREGAAARDPWSHLLFGVLLEDRDGRSARKHLRAAKRPWEGTGEEFLGGSEPSGKLGKDIFASRNRARTREKRVMHSVLQSEPP